MEAIEGGSPEPVSDTMKKLSHGLRGAIIAGPGKELFVADYASIEARVLLWVAKDEEALKIFTSGRDIYCYFADDVYGYPTSKATHPKERDLGKTAVLGLGYQMGAAKFVETCAKASIEITEEFSQKVVTDYREKFWRVKTLWNDMERTACETVERECDVRCGVVTWSYDTDLDFLYCILPSGRKLCYPFPQVKEKATPWGEMRPQLTFMGVDTYTKQWKRQSTYGGMLVENVVQAISRDVMAEAMLRCEWSGLYEVVLSVHDEVIAECEEGLGNIEEFMMLLTILPPWAKYRGRSGGMVEIPIAVEGWKGVRYKK
jgi:DNA polymerase